MRRLSAHPVIGEALAAGELSESWARQICEWADRLPQAQRGDADEILAGAARGGADLSGLAGLAQEMYERSQPDGPDDMFDERYLRLGITFRGAGRAEGDLTPRCAAALEAVLEKLAKKAGPEDTRTAAQRRHDALEEACTRLIGSGILPDGRPDRAYLHITLAQLRSAPGASEVEAAWAAAPGSPARLACRHRGRGGGLRRHRHSSGHRPRGLGRLRPVHRGVPRHPQRPGRLRVHLWWPHLPGAAAAVTADSGPAPGHHAAAGSRRAVRARRAGLLAAWCLPPVATSTTWCPAPVAGRRRLATWSRSARSITSPRSTGGAGR
jgi:hypothetical protein